MYTNLFHFFFSIHNFINIFIFEMKILNTNSMDRVLYLDSKLKETEKLKFADIPTVDIKLLQILIGLRNRKTTIDLDNLPFEY